MTAEAKVPGLSMTAELETLEPEMSEMFQPECFSPELTDICSSVHKPADPHLKRQCTSTISMRSMSSWKDERVQGEAYSCKSFQIMRQVQI